MGRGGDGYSYSIQAMPGPKSVFASNHAGASRSGAEIP
jgi:hypothetical protein